MIQETTEPGLQADQRLVDRGWLRIGAAAAIAAQAMVFSFAVNLADIEGWAYVVVHGILIFSAVATLVFLGGDLVRSAVDSVKERKISIDLLFLVTLAGALAGSLTSTFTKTGSVYYEVVAILVVVHTAGKMLGARSRVAALRAADQTREKFEFCDVVQADGSLMKSRTAGLPQGAVVRVAPGGPISVDGQVISGGGYVQETSMTGEWRPEPRGPGDRVLAGTFSVDGFLEIRADGGVRKLDQILDAVHQARLAPSQLQLQADRLVAWFLPLVVAASVGTFFWWQTHGPWEKALFNAMAVLLVACPCAMGLATPVAVWGGLARLAGFGLVARTGDFLDVLARAETIYIDKTGTLSTESLEVREWLISPAWKSREDWVKKAVGMIEAGIIHPVAVALHADVCRSINDKHLEPPVSRESRDMSGGLSVGVEVRNQRIVPGKGVVAEVRPVGETDEWVEFAVGEADLAQITRLDSRDIGRQQSNNCHPVNDSRIGETAAEMGELSRRGIADTGSGKEVGIFSGGEWIASVVLEEAWRTGMVEAVGDLRRLGCEIAILSGDPRAGEVLRSLQVEVKAGMTPAQKLAEVEAAVRTGRTVVFVGDGINDAAAMSAAQASVAMKSGTELARAASMAVFAGEDLRFLPKAVGLARSVRRGIRRNLVFASGYNIAGMALAAAGALHPVAAALLMLGSSLFVSVGAVRASMHGAEKKA